MNPSTSLNRILGSAKSVTIDVHDEPLRYFAVEVYDGKTEGAVTRSADVTLTGALTKAANALVVMGVAEAPKKRRPRAVKQPRIEAIGVVDTSSPEFVPPTPEQEMAAFGEDNWSRVAPAVKEE